MMRFEPLTIELNYTLKNKPKFFLVHFWRFTTQLFHTQCGFYMPETQLYIPALLFQ